MSQTKLKYIEPYFAKQLINCTRIVHHTNERQPLSIVLGQQCGSYVKPTHQHEEEKS